jgi:hypothetical protein
MMRMRRSGNSRIPVLADGIRVNEVANGSMVG